MNSEGIVLEYSSEPFHKADEIIAGINAHYGTSFYQEDDIDKDFTIGETMPGWNSYEKIELPSNKIAVKEPWTTQVILICGELSNNIFNVLSNGTTCLEVSENGRVINVEGPPSDDDEYIILMISEYNLEATQVVQTIVDYQVGDEIPQWNKYVQYK